MESDCFGWIGLAGFLLLLLLIITIFYTYLFSTRIDPSSCPKSIGDYGVIPGQVGTMLTTCNGDKACQFNVPDLLSAVTKCDSDPQCQSFYYDGTTMQYIQLNSPLRTASPGGLYIRQRGVTS